MKSLALIVAVVLSLALPTIALARRPATASEHRALAASFLGSTDKSVPLHCTSAYISTVNRTWASIEPIHTGDCASAPLGDGIAVLHVEHRRWRLVTEGSSFSCPIQSYPGQPAVPAKVAGDLLSDVHCA